ncbi:GyrI-like domain-containing protein [Bowdeniella massiliensis]|uniref:GyrI-like domain-containing protein n=1 Tax=Bowdeniella massiliensis TaxID=2932264 RepID=UPI0020289FA2|nr:GyrI-like domain-containing protein [Bowdeniella massiliensis]
MRDIGFGVAAIATLLPARGTPAFERALQLQRDSLAGELRGAEEQLHLIEFIPLLERQGIRPTGPGGAIEHDEDFKEAQVDESVWLPVAPGTTADDPLVVVDLAETEVVRAVSVGPYSQITDALSRIADFVAEHGLTLAQRGSDDVATKVFITYLNDPSSTKPEELVTEVNVPIS